jgi:hypothetical protein
MSYSAIVYRIVEHQSKTYEYNATTTPERAQILESLINKTKPDPYFAEWHDLIATQFRYPLPVLPPYQARFRPPNSMTNVFYASEQIETSQHENAFHFLRFRLGLKKTKKTGQRTLFSVKVISENLIDITENADIKKIMDPNQYAASHEFIVKHPSIQVIRYPSCRDPEKRHNVAVREIIALEKKLQSEETISFSYDRRNHEILWIESGVRVAWSLFAPPASKAAKPKTNRKKSKPKKK